MRYHNEKPVIYLSKYGVTYKCNHPLYNKCTLYLMDNQGLAVIQQRFHKKTKSTYWTEIDPWLTDKIYLNLNFINYFNDHSGICQNGIYPTVTVRQLMWALKMKPLKREKWETYFDRKQI